MQQELTRQKDEIDKSTIRSGDFNDLMFNKTIKDVRVEEANNCWNVLVTIDRSTKLCKGPRQH